MLVLHCPVLLVCAVLASSSPSFSLCPPLLPSFPPLSLPLPLPLSPLSPVSHLSPSLPSLLSFLSPLSPLSSSPPSPPSPLLSPLLSLSLSRMMARHYRLSRFISVSYSISSSPFSNYLFFLPYHLLFSTSLLSFFLASAPLSPPSLFPLPSILHQSFLFLSPLFPLPFHPSSISPLLLPLSLPLPFPSFHNLSFSPPSLSHFLSILHQSFLSHPSLSIFSSISPFLPSLSPSSINPSFFLLSSLFSIPPSIHPLLLPLSLPIPPFQFLHPIHPFSLLSLPLPFYPVCHHPSFLTSPSLSILHQSLLFSSSLSLHLSLSILSINPSFSPLSLSILHPPSIHPLLLPLSLPTFPLSILHQFFLPFFHPIIFTCEIWIS
ncbi:hypothetical protein C7M84_000246 [Penaeus vannamei]|uniref:Uncharacterized protein n=1 Tax=Penaeus vannamei TaxID=6689 RepID=A0A3R7QJQ9_PENVA|nr:hypothetical protein C7M84_000246 [Penaeus vannamei]